MKFTWSNTRALAAAAALVVISNAIALAGVAYNRHGEPESVLELTEREVPLQLWSWPDNENSAVHLQLRWRLPGAYDEPGYWGREIQWLTAEQLRELGFDTPPAGTTPEQVLRYARQSTRDVFFALEYAGPAYLAEVERSRASLRKAEAELATAVSNETLAERVNVAKKQLESEEQRSSRLFVVAADLDAGALRKRYPDRKQYAIVRGRLDLRPSDSKVMAQIDGLETDQIRVPYAYRKVVEPYAADRTYFGERPPRYTATVHFGRRLEPWIVQLATTGS